MHHIVFAFGSKSFSVCAFRVDPSLTLCRRKIYLASIERQIVHLDSYLRSLRDRIEGCALRRTA